jgi:nucleoside 2-deoxyribosyltransferase
VYRLKCYVASPLGFEPARQAELEKILDQLRPVVEPINPFFIANEEFIPKIMKASGEEKQKLWCAMAVRLYRVIKDEADMGFAILNGDPPDFGVACELGYGFALHDSGYKKFPMIAYRQDYRRSGETDNNLNSMALPPYLRTGGCFIDSFEAIQPAVKRIAATLAAK